MKRTLLIAAVAAVALFSTAKLTNAAASKNIAVCHVPPGNVLAAHIINIDAKGVPAHITDPKHCGILNGTTYCDYVVAEAPPQGEVPPQQEPPALACQLGQE
jgi:hypothetical protein